MKTNKKTNSKSLLNSSNMIILGKNELKNICGGDWKIQYYIEDGEVKQRLVYTDDETA